MIANRVPRVLIASANTHVSFCWILEHFRLTLSFNFDLSGEQDSAHS